MAKNFVIKDLGLEEIRHFVIDFKIKNLVIKLKKVAAARIKDFGFERKEVAVNYLDFSYFVTEKEKEDFNFNPVKEKLEEAIKNCLIINFKNFKIINYLNLEETTINCY